MSIHWQAGMPRSLHYPDVGLDSVLLGAAGAYGDRVALRDGDTSLTYIQVRDLSLRLARGLRAHGVSPGDMVVIHLPNSIWFPVGYCAILCAGATACPLNPAQPQAALRRQLEESGATAILTHPSCAGALAGGRPEKIRLVIGMPATHAAPAPESPWLPPDAVPLSSLLEHEPLDCGPLDPGAVAHLQLTGGTTGRSKGVRVLHRNLVANIAQSSAWRCGALPVLDYQGGLRLRALPQAQHPHSEPIGQGTFLTVAPFFHGMGLIGLCGNMLMGYTVIIQGRFDPGGYLGEIERHRATKLLGAPAFYHALLASPGIGTRDLSSVRSLFSGGGPIDTATLRRLAEVFPAAEVTEGYGLSEATAMVCMQPSPVAAGDRAGDVGVPLFDTEVELRCPDGETPSEPGTVGEIWVRGPQVTDGYHRDPALTARQFRNGWLRTGDLGQLEERGRLVIAGRAKDMIIYKGYNVYPAHLEEILGEHPDVARSAVVGAARPGVGEVPVAFVVPRSPRPGRTELADSERAGLLMAYVSERVAPYQRIREVRFIAELPLTPAGKVFKDTLREILAAEESGPGAMAGMSRQVDVPCA